MADFTANFTLNQIEAIESTFTLNDGTELEAVFIVEQTPTKLSQLENDDNYVQDADYIHTDNNFTDALLSNLSNQSGTNTGDQDLSSYALISDVPTTLAELTDDSTHRVVTDTEKSTWNGKQDAGDYATVVQLQVVKNLAIAMAVAL